MELEISLDAHSTRHLYEQIYEYIREEIRGGRIARGEKLPSTRALSRSLHVSRSTAELAYEQLLAEGYIRMKRGSGAYVLGIESQLPVSSDIRDAGEASLAGTIIKADSEQDIIDFSPRKIDMSCFPYATWRRILRGLMTGDRSEMFERGDAQGDYELRRAIAHYFHLSRGVCCRPEQIIMGAGNDYLLMLLRGILGDHRKIAMENPTYLRAFRVFQSLGYEVRAVRQDESGMSCEALSLSGCDTAYVMPAHQYPSGIMMPYPRRMELLLWAQEREERYLIEDDYDSEFRYRGNPVPALQSLDRAGKVIYLGTFSKSIAPAIRVSFLILPEKLLDVYHEKCSFVSSTISRIDQSILDEFIRDGYYERYLNRMRNRYRAKHDLCMELLQPFAEKFEISGEGAGLHLILTEKISGMDPEESREEELRLAALAKAAGVRVYPSEEMYIPGMPVPAGQKRMPQILLGFAALNEDDIRNGIAALQRAWQL